MKLKKVTIISIVVLAAVLIGALCVLAYCTTHMEDDSCSHKYDEGVVVKEPNCTDTGLMTYTCTKCEEVKEETIPALGHTLGEWAQTKAPTPYEEGEERAKCANCKYYETRKLEKLDSDKHIAIDDSKGNLSYVAVEDDGSYTLETPKKLGYTFIGWVDAEGKAFAQSGKISEAVLITTVWEIDGTDTLAELIERAAAGVEEIMITADITVSEPVYFIGKTKIFSNGNYTLQRASDYNGDLFVIGQNKDGVGSPLLFIDTLLTLGGGEGTLTIDGNRDNVTVDVVGSALFISDSSTVELYDGIVIANNKKMGNQRVFTCEGFVSTVTTERAGGAAILLVNGTVNMYGGIIENNAVETEYLVVKNDDGTESNVEFAGCGGAVYNRGNFNMFGGIIRNNEALRGGAIYNDEVAWLVSGTISDNLAHSYGGGLSTSSSAETQTLIGHEGDGEGAMRFENNRSMRAGGVMYSNTNSPIIIYGNTEFVNNSTESSGGAIYTGGSLTVRGASFIGNSCVYSGGAIYHHYANAERERRDLELTDCIFEDNSASLGGAVMLSAADANVKEGTYAKITGCSFTGNKAVESEYGAGNGGAIYTTRCSDAIVTGCIFKANVADTNAGAMSIHSGATVQVKECVFNENLAAFGGAMYLSSDSETVIADSEFFGNSAAIREDGRGGNGGAIYSNGISFTLKNTALKSNNADNNGGALYQSSMNLTIDASVSFEDNKADNHGGAVYLTYSTNSEGVRIGSSLSLIGTEFKGNTALAGGAISARSESVLNVTDVQFVGNSTPDAKVSTEFGGGAIYSNNSKITLTNAVFDGNISGYYGGALRLNDSEITLTDVSILNSAGGTGGALFVSGGSLSVNGLTLTNNKADVNGVVYLTRVNAALDTVVATDNEAASGGVLYLSGSASAKINASTFENNLARRGGAIYTDGGTVELTAGNTFRKNVATSRGGAIEAINMATVSVVGVAFESNSAGSHGGAIAIEGVTLTIGENTTFEGNSSEGFGGSVYVNDYKYTPEGEEDEAHIKSHLTVTDASFKNGSALRGGAIYVSSNTYSIANSEFVGNAAVDPEYGGGAIYNTEAISTLSNIKLENNTSHKGGAIALHSGSEMSVSSVVAVGNKSEANEEGKFGIGGVFYLNNSDLSLVADEGKSILLGGDGEQANIAVDGGAIYAISNATVTVSGAEFVGNSASNNGGAIHLSSNGSLKIGSSAFSGNQANTNGGAVYICNQSTLALTDVAVRDNNAGNYGGAVYSASSILTVSGDETVFESNSAVAHGGAFYLSYQILDEVRVPSTLTATGGTFAGNSSVSGGAISGRTDSVITLTGVTLKDNSTPNATATRGEGGGAIYLNNATLNLNASVLEQNSSGYYGGAIRADESAINIKDNCLLVGNVGITGSALYVYHDTDLVAENLTVSNNNSEETYNSVIYIGGGECSFTNVTVSGNRADMGGVFYFNNATVTLSGITATENKAINGGVFYINKSTVVASGINASGNESNLGGVIYARMSTIELSDSTFENNKSGTNGGAIGLAGSELTVSGEYSFTNNSAAGHAGAIYVSYYEEKDENNELIMQWKGKLTATGGSFIGNTAMGGGAISIRSSCEANIAECVFNGNIANGYSGEHDGDGEGGGAIYVGYGALNLHKVTMTENRAEGFGGAVVALQSNVSVVGSTFSKNEAPCGGAIRISGKTLALENVDITENDNGIAASKAKIDVSGKIVIDNNENGNLWLLDGTYVRLTGALTEDSSVGVSVETDGAVIAKIYGENVTDINEYANRFFHDGGDPMYVNENGELAVGFIIVEQPSVFNNYTITATGVPTYAWYSWVDGAVSGEPIAGQTAATLTEGVDGTAYACVVTFNGKSLTSDPIVYASKKHHPVCGETCECVGETHEDIEWIPVMNASELEYAIKLGGSYYLFNDIVLEKTLKVDNSVNICLNGKKITRTGEELFSMIRVEKGATLTLTDCGKTERKGYIDPESGLWREGEYSGDGEAVVYTLYGGVITGGNASLGGAIYAIGDLNLYGINFAGNHAENNGGAIDLVGGTLTAKGDNLFVGNTAVKHAGAIYVTYATAGPAGVLNMTDGIFAHNSAMGGGAVSIRTGCKAAFNGTLFEANAVAGYDGEEEKNNDGNGEGGGAIYVGYGSLELVNVTMKDNVAEYFGGAVDVYQSTVTVTGGSFANNTAVSGGAFCIFDGSQIIVSGATLDGNIATGEGNTQGGGAFNSRESTLTLSGVTLTGNKSAYYGGAINARKGIVTINNTVIERSEGATGAALYFRLDGTQVTIENSTVSNNVATANGVIYMTQAGSLTVNGLTASGNDADRGGVFYVSGGTIELNDVIATENTAKSGGVLYVSGAKVTVNGSTFGSSDKGNSATKGGAAYVASGSLTVDDGTEMCGNAASTGGAIYAEGGQTTIEGGAILSDNTATTGGAIYAVDAAKITIMSASVKNNSSSGSGGAIAIEGSTLIIGEGAVFTDNTSEKFGGAIYIGDFEKDPESATDPAAEKITVKATVNMSGASFNGNSSLRGGAIYVIRSSYSVSNTVFVGNSATELEYGGGAIYSTESEGIFDGVTFTNNTSHKGGAVALHSGSAMTVSSMIAKGNKATANSENKLGIGGVFYLNNATLNLVEGESDAIVIGGEEVGAGNTAVNGGAIYGENKAKVVVSGAELIGNSATVNGGAIYVTNATAEIVGCIFKKNTAVLGGAVYGVSDAQITVENAEFSENNASTNGGAISLANADLIVSGENTVFAKNTAANHGGAIYLSYQTINEVAEGATLNMTSGTFSENTAMGGGAVSIRTNCSATLTGTVFTENSVTGDNGTADGNAEGGGAIYEGYGSLTLVNAVLSNNVASVFGGAISAVGGTITVTGGEFKENTAARGGAINAIEGVKMSFVGTKFTSNSATRDSANTDGGGAINAEKGKLTLSGVVMDGNTSAYYGGAINARKGTVEIKDGTVITNSKGATGAALYFRETGTTVTITDSTISNNTASANGIIYMTGTGTITVDGLTVSENKAAKGGAFYFSGGTHTFSNVTATNNDATATNGGDLMYISGASTSATISYKTDAEKTTWESGTYNSGATVTYKAA